MTISDIRGILEADDNLIAARAGNLDVFSALCFDSRKVQANAGAVFVCLVGAQVDGHAFLEKALENGAGAAVLSDEALYRKKIESDPDTAYFLVTDTRRALACLSAAFFGYPAKKLFLIGITGTKGKTSTSFMICEILSAAGKSVGVIGTTGIRYADQVIETENSTPESYELHRVFADMLRCGVTHVVMEVSSQALMMHRTYGIRFQIGVFTNISPDHIGEHEHPDFESYFACKKLLFRQCDCAVINQDADRADEVRAVADREKIPVVTYSAAGADADFAAEDVRFELTDCLSTAFTLRQYGKIRLNTPGYFSVSNALCAAAVSMRTGADFAAVAEGLRRVRVFGRTEPVTHEKCPFAVIIDYAHNALSLESLFSSVRFYHPARIITVFGCGGNRSKLRRYDMGEISGKYADLSVITSDNPRTESLDDIIEDILVGMRKTSGHYVIVKDRRDAIRYALAEAKKGDLVLIVGKGNQLYEEIGHEKLPFDERKVVKEYFDER